MHWLSVRGPASDHFRKNWTRAKVFLKFWLDFQIWISDSYDAVGLFTAETDETSLSMSWFKSLNTSVAVTA